MLGHFTQVGCTELEEKGLKGSLVQLCGWMQSGEEDTERMRITLQKAHSDGRWGARMRVFFQNFSLRAHIGLNLINYMWKCVKMVENQQKFRNVIITELHSQCVCNVSRRLHGSQSPNNMFHAWDKEKTAVDFCSARFWFWANKNKYLSCWKLWKMPSLKQICRNQTNALALPRASPHIL